MSDAEDVIDTREGREEDDQEMTEDDVAAMRARVIEMEAEAAKLRELQEEEAKASDGPPSDGIVANAVEEDPAVVDGRSIYVGNVDYGATPEEVQQHFMACGTINRVTILCDKFTGQAKGYAYVEFAEASSIEAALTLNESLFRARQISVVQKRTNVPGMGARGRGRGGRRPYRGGYQSRGGYQPYARGRGRGRGRGGY